MAKVVEGYLPGKQRGTHKRKEDGEFFTVERIENAGFIVKDLKGKTIEHYGKKDMADFNEKYVSIRVANEKSKNKKG